MNLNNRDYGVVLITAIFLVLLIATLGIGLLLSVNTQLEMIGVSINSAKAFYCAESGISEAKLYLKSVINWSGLAGNLVSGSIPSGSYIVQVVPPADISVITVKSTGKTSGFQRIIHVTLDKQMVPGEIIQRDWKEI